MARKQNHVKLCLWTHVQNESHIILNMLESVADYIDYWVLIDNGSSDNTREIINDFFIQKGIKGKLYQSEIGWKGHGINRQHSWDFLNKTNHGCDYILRLDADDVLIVDDNFDWSEINGHEAYQIIYDNGCYVMPRMWMWRSDLPWAWKDDVAHETIYLPDNRQPDLKVLSFGFKQSTVGCGNSYSDPIKYIKDILKLEIQIHERLANGSNIYDEIYHVTYLCKSFVFCGVNIIDGSWDKYFVFGKDHIKNFLNRGIFYYSELIKTNNQNWEFFYERSFLHEALGSYSEMVSDLETANSIAPERSESSFKLLRYYQNINDNNNIIKHANNIKNSPFKIEHWPYGVLYSCYYIYNQELRKEIDNILKENYIKVINGSIFI